MPRRPSLSRARWDQRVGQAVPTMRSWTAHACSVGDWVGSEHRGCIKPVAAPAARCQLRSFALGARPVASLKPCSVEHFLIRYFTHAAV